MISEAQLGEIAIAVLEHHGACSDCAGGYRRHAAVCSGCTSSGAQPMPKVHAVVVGRCLNFNLFFRAQLRWAIDERKTDDARA